MMYNPEKMVTSKGPLPISGPGGPCFPSRYSPTYRTAESMRRCMPNHNVSMVPILPFIQLLNDCGCEK